MRVASLLLLLGLVARSNAISLALFNGGSQFFEAIEEGWFHRCNILGITCYSSKITTPETTEECVENRRVQIQEWIELGVQGIALKPCSDKEAMRELFKDVNAAGVHITNFDSDVANSTRAAYIGTDNEFMGRTLAKLLRQLRPHGGTYVWVGWKDDRGDGFIQEIERYNDRDDRGHWHEAVGPTHDYLWGRPGENLTKFHGPVGNNFMPVMERAALLNPTAIVFFKQTPMRHENYTDFVDKHRHREIIYIGTDGADYQLAYLNRRYVDGLVGQLPYEMGTESAQVLYDLITTGMVKEEFHSTNVVAYNLIPLELPSLDVDENLIGDLKYIGYTCFGIVMLSVLACTGWTVFYRTAVIVRAAQPFFLFMISAGVLVMAGSMIPLTFDDGGDEESISHTKAVGICMSVPWLAFTGFTVTFSALFSKLWRVNRLFESAQKPQRRGNVTEMDVLAPFIILLGANLAVLTCWTILDPLKYSREEHMGTDYWNRVISTYGTCGSENVVAYLVPLAGINFCSVAIAGWQAIQARGIQSEFSEAKYIGLAVGGLFQAFLTGIPVIVVVRDQPQAYYVVLTMIIFAVCEGLLLLIFLPKIYMQRQYAGLTEEEQKLLFQQRIRDSSHESSHVGMRGSSNDGASSSSFKGSKPPAHTPPVSNQLESVDEGDEGLDLSASDFRLSEIMETEVSRKPPTVVVHSETEGPPPEQAPIPPPSQTSTFVHETAPTDEASDDLDDSETTGPSDDSPLDD